jgi:hypothetical protein
MAGLPTSAEFVEDVVPDGVLRLDETVQREESLGHERLHATGTVPRTIRPLVRHRQGR